MQENHHDDDSSVSDRSTSFLRLRLRVIITFILLILPFFYFWDWEEISDAGTPQDVVVVVVIVEDDNETSIPSSSSLSKSFNNNSIQTDADTTKNNNTTSTAASTVVDDDDNSHLILEKNNENQQKEQENSHNHFHGHHSCYINYKTPLERSLDVIEQYQQASKYGFGNCGDAADDDDDSKNNKGTSLEKTVSKFSQYPIVLIDDGYGDNSANTNIINNKIVPMLRIPSRSDKNGQLKYVPLKHISFVFQAYTHNNVPRTRGGDEFILTFHGWTTTTETKTGDKSNSIGFKVAVVAHDYHNGTYSVTLPLPTSLSLTSFNMTLMNFYTCYQGYTTDRVYSQIGQGEYYKTSEVLDKQPMNILPHDSFYQYLEKQQQQQDHFTENNNNNKVGNINIKDMKSIVDSSSSTSLPPCPNTQQGVDWYSHGIWVESGIQDQAGITNNAIWSPLCCQPPPFNRKNYNDVKMIRIGDSTLPLQTLQVGNVYEFSAKGPHYNKWINFLWDLVGDDDDDNRNNKDISDATTQLKTTKKQFMEADALVINTGLHFLLHGHYRAERVVDLVIRMICQLGVVFPGKIMWVGPVPIQQHLFWKKIDQKDSDVRHINAIMRERIQSSNGKLQDLCSNTSISTLDSFSNHNTGDFLSQEEIEAKLTPTARVQYNVTKNRETLLEKLKQIELNNNNNNTSLTTTMYENRHVWFTEIDHLLRPRPESYRKNDKIHDVENVPGQGMLFFGRHKEWIFTNAKLRKLGEM